MAAQNMVFEPLVVNTKEASNPGSRKAGKSPGWEGIHLYLRKDVAFTDGTPFNAEAVKANMDAIREQPSPARVADMVNEIDRNEPLTNIPTSWCSSIPTTLRW